MTRWLEQLVRPHSVASFLDDFWGKQALYIAGEPRKFEAIYSLERFERRMRDLDRRRAPPSFNVRATFDRRWADGQAPTLPVEPAIVRTAYEAGATVCCAALDLVDPDLGALVGSLKAELGYPGTIHVNAYWSPDGCGFGAHFDARIATTLQIEGSKKWTFSRTPGIAWPTANGVLRNEAIAYEDAHAHDPWEHEHDASSLSNWREVTLAPGDLLCLPAGGWRAAEAKGQSFALNITFAPLSTGTMLGSALDAELLEDEAWRFVPPLLDAAGGGGPRVAALVGVRERLDRAIEMLMQWRDDPERLVHVAAELAAADLPSPKPIDVERDIGLVEANPFLLVLSAPSDENLLLLANAGASVRANGTTAAILRAILRSPPFQPSELVVGGVERATIVRACHELARVGVLVRSG